MHWAISTIVLFGCAAPSAAPSDSPNAPAIGVLVVDFEEVLVRLAAGLSQDALAARPFPGPAHARPIPVPRVNRIPVVVVSVDPGPRLTTHAIRGP